MSGDPVVETKPNPLRKVQSADLMFRNRHGIVVFPVPCEDTFSPLCISRKSSTSTSRIYGRDILKSRHIT